MEDVEHPLVVADLELEAAPRSAVFHHDDHAVVALAPEQPDVEAVVRAAVELAKGIDHGAIVAAGRTPGHADRPATQTRLPGGSGRASPTRTVGAPRRDAD